MSFLCVSCICCEFISRRGIHLQSFCECSASALLPSPSDDVQHPWHLLAVLPLPDLLPLYAYICIHFYAAFAAGPCDLGQLFQVPCCLPCLHAVGEGGSGWHLNLVLFCLQEEICHARTGGKLQEPMITLTAAGLAQASAVATHAAHSRSGGAKLSNARTWLPMLRPPPLDDCVNNLAACVAGMPAAVLQTAAACGREYARYGEVTCWQRLEDTEQWRYKQARVAVMRSLSHGLVCDWAPELNSTYYYFCLSCRRLGC